MKGDKIIIEEHHYRAAKVILDTILDEIKASKKYTIAVSGESGSGKSETATALKELLEKEGVKSVVFGQDDYYFYPPKSNDAKRREEFSWVGTNEVKLDLLNSHLKAVLNGAAEIEKPLVDYNLNSIESEKIAIDDVVVAIAEGTYVGLIKDAKRKVFIARNRLETLAARKKRNRGNEVGDPFIEEVLKLEHKIVSGHRHLADFVISKDYDVTVVK